MSEPPLLYVAFGFTIALIIAKFLVAILFYRIYQNDKENKLVLGASLVFLCNGISRILMVIFDYFFALAFLLPADEVSFLGLSAISFASLVGSFVVLLSTDPLFPSCPLVLDA